MNDLELKMLGELQLKQLLAARNQIRNKLSGIQSAIDVIPYIELNRNGYPCVFSFCGEYEFSLGADFALAKTGGMSLQLREDGDEAVVFKDGSYIITRGMDYVAVDRDGQDTVFIPKSHY